ncbi:conserved hypothetical protein [Gammaproteobacteria bacterium]
MNTLSSSIEETILPGLERKIWDAINLGLILIDANARVVLWNTWMAKHSGIPVEAAMGHSIESVFPDGVSASFKVAVRNVLSRKLPAMLSNALHHSPLPLYPLNTSHRRQERIQQSITITPIAADAQHGFCLIQVTDASVSVKRESMLKSTSEKLSIETVTDGLTGVFNRRFFDKRYKSEFERAQRQHKPISLAMIDVDFFKAYNDTYGHPAGDNVLIIIANSLKTQLNRSSDVVVRYGGEEFVVILPDCSVEGAKLVAEKLRLAVVELNIPHEKSKIENHVTISIGVASYLSGATCNAKGLLEIADMALYNAKNSGRNCVRQGSV